MIDIIENKDLIQDVSKYDVILVGTSIMNALGNGFQYKVKKNFDYVNRVNKSTPYGDNRKLGTVRVVDGSPIFCLCYINKGRRRPDLYPDYLDYDALDSCLDLISKNFSGKRIASTIMGNSKFEGGGDKERILEIFKRHFNESDVFLYDYEQTDYKEDNKKKWSEIVSNIGSDNYRNLKKEYLWVNEFGELSPVPEELSEFEIKKIIKKHKENLQN